MKTNRILCNTANGTLYFYHSKFVPRLCHRYQPSCFDGRLSLLQLLQNFQIVFSQRENPPTLKVTEVEYNVLLSWYKFSVWLFYFLFFDRCMSEIKVFLVVFCIVIIRKHTLIYVFLFNAFTKNVRCTQSKPFCVPKIHLLFIEVTVPSQSTHTPPDKQQSSYFLLK